MNIIWKKIKEFQDIKYETGTHDAEGINKIIVGIILVGAINVIFITYSIRNTYGIAKNE